VPIRTGRANAMAMASNASKKVNAQMMIRAFICHEVKGSRSILLVISEIFSFATFAGI
jgi:hypothetical protein